MAISTMVIKAKYGDMMRRFNVQIINKEMCVNIFELKAKLWSLFDIVTKADLILTYIDEEGDVITMNDDDDLRDIVMQGLNPLRITVKVDPSSESEIQRLLEAISKNQIQAETKPNASGPKMDHINFIDSLMEFEASLSKCLAQSSSTSSEVPLSTSTPRETKDFNSNTTADYTIDNNKKSKKISECCSSEEASLASLSELVPYLPSQNDATWSVVHNGVSCNGCGVNPITGPRFKSTVEENYNLCRICYLKSRNVTNYVEIGNAVDHWPPISLQQGLSSSQANVVESSKARRGIGKLDSCFVEDVTIVDETVMAPSTRFTKIWRMENTGTLAWPQKTQVVWTGGDRLSNQFMVKVKEIPATGLPVGEQIDVGVDFVAPEFPGRYISHWMLASPSGTLFGAHIWVHIQVSDLKETATPCNNICGLNLNVPPLSNPCPGVGYANDHPIIMQHDTQFVNLEHNKQPNDETLLVGGSTSSSCSPVASSYPIENLTEVVTSSPPFIARCS